MVEKENDIVSVPAAIPNNNNNVSDSAANRSTNGTPQNKSDVLKSLGFHFFEAYYTKLSDHPDDIGTFYGDDSNFVLGEVEEIGRENIQNAIMKMNFGNCKSRFYSIKAVSAGENKVFQVCGELTLRGQPAPRRFCQTIILASPSPDAPNVLYVKSNIFQWLDNAFPVNSAEKVYFISPPTTVLPTHPAQAIQNGGNEVMPDKQIADKPLQNGGDTYHLQKSEVNSTQPIGKEPVATNDELIQAPPPGLEKLPMDMQAKMNKTPEKPLTLNGLPAAAEERKSTADANKDKNLNKNIEVGFEANIGKNEQNSQSQSSLQYQKAAKSSNEPKSWNKVVSGGQNKPLTSQTTLSSQPSLPSKEMAESKSPVQFNEQTKVQNPQTNANDQQQPKDDNSSPPPTAAVERQRSTSNDIGSGTVTGVAQNKTNILRPRSDWPYRIYFNNLGKPSKFVENKIGQEEMMADLMRITPGVEFVAIKPNSLRASYKHAFGFIDFTTAEDMQAVYNASKKEDDKYRLNVKIPHFEFDGFIILTSDKTSNLGAGKPGAGNMNVNNAGGGGWSNFAGGGHGGRQQQQQSHYYYRGGEQQQRKAIPAVKD